MYCLSGSCIIFKSCTKYKMCGHVQCMYVYMRRTCSQIDHCTLYSIYCLEMEDGRMKTFVEFIPVNSVVIEGLITKFSAWIHTKKSRNLSHMSWTWKIISMSFSSRKFQKTPILWSANRVLSRGNIFFSSPCHLKDKESWIK